MKATRVGGENSPWCRWKVAIMLLAKYCVACSLIALAKPSELLIAAPPNAAPIETSTRESSIDPNHCKACHAEEVNGFARSKMSRSTRVGGLEPAGKVQVSGTTITMRSDKAGSWQTIEDRRGSNTYHVDYVIGSGSHASGYIVDIANHLFQSPVAYYSARAAYGVAPGYEKILDPDFTRPITQGCVFCHSGSFDAVAGTINEYRSRPFPQLGIGCDRCHGSPAAHLADPKMGNIINPTKLEHAARDSVCEQCHLFGVARILNPGKQFSDFKAGSALEDTFTIYHDLSTGDTKSGLKVISHSEQLALSKCVLASAGKLWCGTCHDPHNEPTTPVSFYRERCLLCHERTTFALSHPDKLSDCIGCHMPKREVQDGGHGVFTDHHIQRRPDSSTADTSSVRSAEITPWRNPPAQLAGRNLGIAMIEAGMDRSSAKDILTGYRKLTEVQQQFPQDSEMYNSFGSALLAGHQYSEAVQAFQLALRFDPSSAKKETSLGQAYLLLGERDSGEHHLERAMELDPLDLTAAALLIQSYDQGGKPEKSEQLSKKLADLTRETVSAK